MPYESNIAPKTPQGLPPVEPPSGRFLVQLFLVPGLIVAGVVAILLFFNWLVSGPRSPESFLRKLDDPNPEVRWRAAADLSQVLLRDDQLAANSDFALALALRLENARTELALPEQELSARVDKLSPEQATREQAKLEQERNYVNYLAASIGNFLTPVGAPVLQKLAETDKGVEPQALAIRRRATALLALAVLGENLKRFDKLPPVQKEAIVAALGEVHANTDQARWAAEARRHLQARLRKEADVTGMDRTIETCGLADDPYLRELTAFAANFWPASGAAKTRIEETLVRLSHDSGQGESQLDEWATDDGSETKPVTKIPGLKVRMNATIALARLGSDKVRLEMLQEMLEENILRKAFVLRSKNGQELPHEAMVIDTILNTLKAVGELHRQLPKLPMSEIRAAVEKLTANDNAAIRNGAREIQVAMQE